MTQVSSTAPPYPRQLCTVPQLYQHLVELRAWCVLMGTHGLDVTHRKVFTQEPLLEIPGQDLLSSVPLLHLTSCMADIRRCREAFDMLEREYAYGSPEASPLLFNILCRARAVLVLAFTTPTEIYAKTSQVRQANRERARQMFQMVTQSHREQGLPPPSGLAQLLGVDPRDLTENDQDPEQEQEQL